MKKLFNNKHLILGVVVGAMLVFIISNFTTERKLNNLQLTLDLAIDKSLNETQDLAFLIGEGALTKGAESIIADCKPNERAAFEGKLNNLDKGLSRVDLLEVDTLFSRCAPVQSVRRTLMVMDLARNIQTLDSLLIQRKQIGEYTKYDYKVENLKKLLVSEQKITELSFDLVYLQRDIIDLLLAGKSANSNEANVLKEKGAKLHQEILQVATEASIYREAIKSS